MGVPCEEMCKRLKIYPDGCQCPGFNGQAATPGDGRSCVAQWCQDPAAPCPNDGFVECVGASSAVSALQWSKVMERVDTGFAALLETARMHKSSVFTKSAETSATACNKNDKAMQVLLQHKVDNMGVPCEEMCKRLKIYPDGCQCPGFNGQAATPGDGRSCVAQWCQDPAAPCPNDGFVECVGASSAVSTSVEQSLCTGGLHSPRLLGTSQATQPFPPKTIFVQMRRKKLWSYQPPPSRCQPGGARGDTCRSGTA